MFTRERSRMASEEDQKAYEDLVASTAIPTELGDINKDDLPGPEALVNPGANYLVLFLLVCVDHPLDFSFGKPAGGKHRNGVAGPEGF